MLFVIVIVHHYAVKVNHLSCDYDECRFVGGGSARSSLGAGPASVAALGELYLHHLYDMVVEGWKFHFIYVLLCIAEFIASAFLPMWIDWYLHGNWVGDDAQQTGSCCMLHSYMDMVRRKT